MMNARAFSLIVSALILLAVRADAVIVETPSTHSGIDAREPSFVWPMANNPDHFDWSSTNTFHFNWQTGLQTWLDTSRAQTFLRNLSSSVHDPALSGALNELITNNFQLNPAITSDFQNWLQSHHLSLDSDCGTNFGSWMQNQEGDDRSTCDRDGLRHHHGGGDSDEENNRGDDDDQGNENQGNGPVAVPEPGSLAFLLSGALSLGIYAARRR